MNLAEDLTARGLEQAVEKIRSSARTLFIMCGYPYAGKTYIAELLVKRTGAAYVSIDRIFHALGYSWDENRLPDSGVWESIFSHSFEEVRNALRAHKNVLYDSTNQTCASRERLRELARSLGAESFVVFISSSKETCIRRWRESADSKARHTISRELLEKTIDEFEAPTGLEASITIEN